MDTIILAAVLMACLFIGNVGLVLIIRVLFIIHSDGDYVRVKTFFHRWLFGGKKQLFVSPQGSLTIHHSHKNALLTGMGFIVENVTITKGK